VLAGTDFWDCMPGNYRIVARCDRLDTDLEQNCDRSQAPGSKASPPIRAKPGKPHRTSIKELPVFGNSRKPFGGNRMLERRKAE